MSASSPAGPRESLTNRGVNLVIAAVVVAAYVPILLDPDLDQVSLPQLLVLVSLGIGYLLMTIFGWHQFEQMGEPLWLAVLYFTAQVAITLYASYLSLHLPLEGFLWLLILPVTAQSLSLPRAGTALVSVTFLVGLFLIVNGVADLQVALESTLGVGAGMLFTLVFTQIARREQAARQEIERLAGELRQANQQLRAHSVQAEELATTKERNRLAREIHDSLGHYLTALNMQLGAAQAVFDVDRERALDALQKAQRLAQEGLADVRRSVAALRESPATDRPLPEAVGLLLADVVAAGMVAELTVQGEPRPLEPRTTLTLYRAAQEALTNSSKHARATRVDVTLDYRPADAVRLRVADNGVGTDHPEGGFGLLGLRERVDLLGGSLEVHSAPGEGFVLEITVPDA